MAEEKISIYNKMLERSTEKRKLAYRLLYTSISLMVVGIGIVIWQLKDMAGESPEPIQIISKISFVIFIIYIIQVLLKLYRYNMLSAYFFTACCDALDMHDELDDKKRDTFEKLIKVLVPDLGFFNETDPPKLSDLTTGKDKKE